MNHRPAQPHAVGPNAGLIHGIMRVVNNFTILLSFFGPGDQLDGFLIGIDEVQIANLTAGKPGRFFQGHLHNFLLAQLRGALADLKQRRDALSQFEQAGREDLAARERFEITVIDTFMPAALSEAEVDALIEQAVASTGAAEMKDMGKVMGALKGEIAGRADMGAVSAKVKARLA